MKKPIPPNKDKRCNAVFPCNLLSLFYSGFLPGINLCNGEIPYGSDKYAGKCSDDPFGFHLKQIRCNADICDSANTAS